MFLVRKKTEENTYGLGETALHLGQGLSDTAELYTGPTLASRKVFLILCHLNKRPPLLKGIVFSIKSTRYILLIFIGSIGSISVTAKISL